MTQLKTGAITINYDQLRMGFADIRFTLLPKRATLYIKVVWKTNLSYNFIRILKITYFI